MKKEGFYSSGEFAKKAHVTKKTIRYYDEHNILKPSFVSDSGARFYSDEDFARLQQILFLKYLGFSLADIKEMTVRNSDKHFFSESLHMQLGLIEEKIEQMQLIKTALVDASKAVKQEKNVDWSKMMQLVNVNEMEHKLKVQYQNSSNISARINLHEEFSKNKQGWFPWLFEQCELKSGESVLELGCGDASLWRMNREKIPEKINVILSDISDGMIRDVRRSMKDMGEDFDVVIHGQGIIEINPAGISKATGIRKVCEMLDIPNENTFAFGDSANDLEMLAYVAHSIAMGNGTEEVKNTAEYVTRSVDEDGILSALEHFGLL